MTDTGAEVPRLVPEQPLPPYSYVPGKSPHPLSDPQGHSFGMRREVPEPLTPDNWQASRPYLFGIDLFNHGYYWEAHEVWEGLWLACGRAGTTADLLKGLIQLTAAGVKVRQGVPRGVASLGAGAASLFQKVLDALGPSTNRSLGLDGAELLAFALELAARPDRGPVAEGAVVRVLPLVLRPR